MASVTKTPTKRVIANILSGGALTSPDNAILVIGLRGIEGDTTTILPDLKPVNANYPKIGLYKPYKLPSFNSGNSCLNWLSNCGFKVTLGVQYNETFPAPNSISVSTNGLTVSLNWTQSPYGFQSLIGIPLSGTATQSAATGSLISASVNTNNSSTLVLSIGIGTTFTTTGNISISFINNSDNQPDKNRTEQICMQLYHLFETLNGCASQVASPSANFPDVYISMLTQQDGGYSPSSTPISLPSPSVVTVANGITTLTWNDQGTAIANQNLLNSFGLLPDSQLGNTIVSQNGSSAASGTFVAKYLTNLTLASSPSLGSGKLGSTVTLAPFSVSIILNNATGAFVTTETLNIKLDATQDVFTLNKSVYKPYIVGWHEDNSTNSSLNNVFTTAVGVSGLNSNSSIAQNQGGRTFGFLANISVSKYLISSLPTAYHDTNAMVWAWYPYQAMITDVPLTACHVAACMCALASLNGKPFDPLNKIYFPSLPVSSDTTQFISVGTQGDSESALQLGFSPLYINTNGQASTVRVVTGELTIPGSGSQIDNEFFPITTWQIISAFGQDLINYYSSPQFTNTRKTMDVGQSILAGAIAMARTYEKAGMLENVENSKTYFILTNDSTDPSKWVLQIPVQIVPEFNSLDIDLNILSSLLSFGVSL
jgi:hypothetical protein